MIKLKDSHQESEWYATLFLESDEVINSFVMDCSANVSVDERAGVVVGENACEIEVSEKTVSFVLAGNTFRVSAHITDGGDFECFGTKVKAFSKKPDPAEEVTEAPDVDPIDEDDILPESESYYLENVENFTSNQWFDDLPKLGMSKGDIEKLATLKYYIRVNGDVDLTKVTEQVSEHNPDNVNRVIRLMPKDKFESLFPNSVNMAQKGNFVPGKVFSYLNFLKAVAVLPAYAGDYKDFPGKKTDIMEDPNVAAKKLLATTFAHAIQETSQSGIPGGDYTHKIDGTFDALVEDGLPELPDEFGVFAKGGRLHALTKGNKYYGRGAKQLSYPSNYANTSLLLYGDLRLVKFPHLVETESCLAFLTAITYAMIPKSGLPSLVEVMDGTWHDKVNDPEQDAPEEFLKTYDRDFPLTVLLVNGGPEANGSCKNAGNSQIRIDSYNYLSTSEDLLDPDVQYPIETGEGYNSVFYLMKDTINNPRSEHSYHKLFFRPYYYNPEDKRVVAWDTNILVYGGVGLKEML